MLLNRFHFLLLFESVPTFGKGTNILSPDGNAQFHVSGTMYSVGQFSVHCANLDGGIQGFLQCIVKIRQTQ